MGIGRGQLLEAFRTADHDLWVVGGALRDELLGRDGHDEDFATGALPDEVERLAREAGAQVTTVGKQWGTIGVNLDGRWSEITSFRGDAYTAGSRWPDVTYSDRIEDDLARRDFTINALARNAFTGEVLDLFDGRADLERRLIRAVGEPALRFREDPLRILRGLRFASQLDFDIDADTYAGMIAEAPLLASLSQERVTVELDKLLQGEAPAKGLELLLLSGALAVILPELLSMPGCEQNRFHKFDVWGHTVATVAAIDGGDLGLRRWTALVHDIGKPAVRHVKANGEWGFYRHETIGEELASALLDRLKLGRKEARTIALLVRRHMDRPDPADGRSVRRFMAKSEGFWEDLLALKRADNASHTYDDHDYHDRLEAACREAAEVDAARLRAESPLSGDDLVALFGQPPGPWIRPIKDSLGAMVLDGDLEPGDREAATTIARRLFATAQLTDTAPG